MKNSVKSISIATRQLRGIMAFLVIEFVLGITLTTLIGYNQNKHSGVQTGFLIAHIVVGIGLLLGAIARLVVSIREKYLVVPSIVGLLSIVAAFVSGIIAANNSSGIAVFFMALFFVVAFVAYGSSLGRITPGPS